MPLKGCKQSEEHTRKIAEAKKGKHYPKISESKKGFKNSNFGKHLSGKHRKKISESHKGKKHFMFGKHLSLETRRKISESSKGAKNSNWKDGITPDNKKIRDSLEFRLWREAVFARDNYTCQKCGERGGYLQAHHIFNFATYINRRFDIENGITFCKKCHKEFHRIYGTKNNTKEQLKEFLFNF